MEFSFAGRSTNTIGHLAASLHDIMARAQKDRLNGVTTSSSYKLSLPQGTVLQPVRASLRLFFETVEPLCWPHKTVKDVALARSRSLKNTYRECFSG